MPTFDFFYGGKSGAAGSPPYRSFLRRASSRRPTSNGLALAAHACHTPACLEVPSGSFFLDKNIRSEQSNFYSSLGGVATVERNDESEHRFGDEVSSALHLHPTTAAHDDRPLLQQARRPPRLISRHSGYIRSSGSQSSMSKPAVVILGGLGFLGRRMVEHLVRENLADHIRVVDKAVKQTAYLDAAASAALADPRVTVIQANLASEAGAGKAMAPFPGDRIPEIVINMAGESKYGQDETAYTKGIAELTRLCATVAKAAGVRQFIQVSTAQVVPFFVFDSVSIAL